MREPDLPSLSILIPSIPDRSEMLYNLLEDLNNQIGRGVMRDYVEILTDCRDKNIRIGTKRNDLLNRAKHYFSCFIDDDDEVSDQYIAIILEAILKYNHENGSFPDCTSLRGKYYVDGVFDGGFEHSIKYKEWKTLDALAVPYPIKYERNPNHLNCIKSSIAKQFKFPETNFGEDHDWSKQLQASGLLKTEVHIPEILYYYKYKSKK